LAFVSEREKQLGVFLARSLSYYKPKKDDTEVINKLESMVRELPSKGFDEYF